MRIAIDMDEVIADTHSAIRDLYRRSGHTWSEEELRGVKIHDLTDDDAAGRFVTEVLDEGHIFGVLEVIEGAQDGVKALADEHEVFIATAAMEHPGSFGPKFQWLRRHFPFLDPLNFIFMGDKSILGADVLIDDSVRHFAKFRGTGVVFTAPHNVDEPHTPRLDRWADAPELMARIAAERAA